MATAADYDTGRNLYCPVAWGGGHCDRLPQIMQDLVALRFDAIVTIGPGVGAARRATRSIPIVSVGTDDPVEAGAVAGLARPGGNVTGHAGEVDVMQMGTKRLQLLREATPRASRVAILGYMPKTLETSWRSSLESAARSLGESIFWAEARSPEQLGAALGAIQKEGPNSLYVQMTPPTYAQVRRIADFAASQELPAIFEGRVGPENGGLMSYASNIAELFARAASFVDKILKGARPYDLPMEQPTKFELVINRQAVSALGITVPQSLQQLVDEWIRA